MANTPIESLDFDELKNSLKDYLRGQEKFQDYDFEGSTMNILLDLLAYNTHYQAFYANMVANEAFLDSARKRNSVVSLGKHLSYIPRSRKASRIGLNVKYKQPEDINQARSNIIRATSGAFILPRGIRFSAKGPNSDTYVFNTLEDYRFDVVAGDLIARNVVAYEGTLKTDSFIVNTKDSTQKFLLTDKNVDIDTIIVRVYASVSDSRGINENWRRANDITELNGDSAAFFVQENQDGTWEIYFGDGIIGRATENGNVIRAIYLSSSGATANGVGSDETDLSPAFTDQTNTYEVTIVKDSLGFPVSSYGGEDPEDIDSIRFYAPRSYQAQERAVTTNDYLAILVS